MADSTMNINDAYQLANHLLEFGNIYQAELLYNKILMVDSNFLDGKVMFLTKLLSDNHQVKHAYRWLVSTSNDYLIEKRIPWFSFDATDFLNTYLSNLPVSNPLVLEYGSGGSTLYFAKNNASVISIEHDSSWYNTLDKYISKYTNIDYINIQPEMVENATQQADPSNPWLYQSADRKYINYKFIRYVSKIDDYPDSYFNIISIDGRARASCIMHSIKKVKVGGIIILDDSDREYYTKNTWQYLTGFIRRDFYGAKPITNFYSRTSIYIRIDE
jgi:hypothetical protein